MFWNLSYKARAYFSLQTNEVNFIEDNDLNVEHFVNLFKLTYSHDDIEDKFLPLELMYGCVEDKVDLKNWNW